jgi:basic membrane lipoprotein Med (substrate-binding protein (PBP1-ABC) superfamily)
MRANHVVPAITAVAALTLAASSLAVAQESQVDTRFPNEFGPTLVTAVVRSALDDAAMNRTIVSTASDYHEQIGGKTTAPEIPKKNAKKAVERGGWLAPDPLKDTDAVTQEVLDLAGQYSPNLIIISGGDWKADVGIARANPSSTIIDLDQPTPCLAENSQPDLTGECLGGVGAMPGNYSVMEFAVEEGAYLAGVVAARESRGQPLGIISGAAECLECDRYVTGFINGALSVEPDIEIQLAYLADDEVAGFGDEASAKTYTEAFLDVYQPGVLLPVGRGATLGMVEAACDAGVMVIGAGIDITAQRPDLDCVMASVYPDMQRAVQESMFYFSTGGNASVTTYDLAGGGVVITDEWRLSPTKRVDTNDFYSEAELAIQTGQVQACPDGCGVLPRETTPAG